MEKRVEKLTDEDILMNVNHFDTCIPSSAKPRTEATIRQIVVLCLSETHAANPRTIITAQKIMHNVSSIHTPDTGRTYMHRITGNEYGWGSLPGFDIRHNKDAYDWPDGRLELTFDRQKYIEGTQVNIDYTKYDNLENA